MRVYGLLFTFNFLGAQFLFCLSDAEFIRRQFDAIHAIQNIFILRNPLESLYSIAPFTIIQTLISSIMENAEFWPGHTCRISSSPEGFIPVFYAIA